MFSRVIFGTSLGEYSDPIICAMEGLKKLGVEEIVLTHALNIRDVGTLYENLRRLALPKLEAQKKQLEEMGFRVETEIPLGLPYYEINRLAAEKNASLIVVYSVAETFLGDVLTGGIAYEVMNRAEKPVLVLRARAFEENGHRRCEVLCPDLSRNLLYPTDFSDNAERAFAAVEKVVESGCRKVTLLHVQEKERIEKYLEDRLEEFNQNDQARLERLKKQLLEKGAEEVKIAIPYGHATKEILKKVRENDFTLIVMGSQGRGFISEVFLGSVSHNVARHAPVPVMLIPALRE